MGLSGSRPGPPLGYVFPRAVGVLPPPRRVSQVPRLIYPCALSPTTPEGPAGALLIASPPIAGFITFGRLATSISVTRPNRVRLRYGSQVCFPGFHRPDCSSPLRFSYMYERAIYMVNSFQFTRSARLSRVPKYGKKNLTSCSFLLCGPGAFACTILAHSGSVSTRPMAGQAT